MFNFSGWTEVALAILLVFFGIAVVILVIALLLKIWHADQNSEAAQIIRLVKQANAGHLEAQAECDQHPFVGKKIVFRNGGPRTRYRASSEVFTWL